MLAPGQQLQTRTQNCATIQGPSTRRRIAIKTAAASKKATVSKRPRSLDNNANHSHSDCTTQPAATNSNKRPRSTQHEMISTAGRALRCITKLKLGTTPNSNSIQTHTPDLQDAPRAGMRPNHPSTTAHGSSSTATAVNGKSPSLQDSCTGSFQVVPTLSPADTTHSMQDGAGVQEMPAHANSTRAEPFSLGVQWDAYHSNPTQDHPGYPRGYWFRQPSPFAAFASTPAGSEEQQQQEKQEQEQQRERPAGQKQQQKDSSADADAAAWGYDALHMA